MARRAGCPSAVLLLAAALVATGAVACGGDAAPESAGVVTVTVTASAPEETTATTAPPPEPSPTASTDGVDPGGSGDLVALAEDAVDVTPGDGPALPNFGSPSGNIQCVLGGDGEPDSAYVQCVALEADWAVPEEAGCELDWAPTELSLASDVYAGGCRGDTFLTDEPVVLGYGEAWTLDPITCVSRRDGMTCVDVDTGHGFQISRGSYLVS